MDFLIQIIKFMIKNKKLWLLPLMIILIALGALLILAQGSVVAPLIYTLF